MTKRLEADETVSGAPGHGKAVHAFPGSDPEPSWRTDSASIAASDDWKIGTGTAEPASTTAKPSQLGTATPVLAVHALPVDAKAMVALAQ
jgi:hypothetical protein